MNTPHELGAALARACEMRRYSAERSTRHKALTRREQRLHSRRETEALDAVYAALAAERGWIVAKHSSNLQQLRTGRPARNSIADWSGDYGHRALGGLFDHPTYFRERTRPYRPAAIISHTYNVPASAFEQWQQGNPELMAQNVASAKKTYDWLANDMPGELGLRCEILWDVELNPYNPGGCIALLFVRATN